VAQVNLSYSPEELKVQPLLEEQLFDELE